MVNNVTVREGSSLVSFLLIMHKHGSLICPQSFCRIERHVQNLQAISLDFLGVPGSEVASKTAELIEQNGFPSDKRLGAGVVDGRSVWADGNTPSKFVAALQAKVT